MSKKSAVTTRPAGDPVEAAQAEAVRLRDREIEIWRKRRQRMADLLDLEARTGRQVADGGSEADAGRLLAEGRASLDVLDRAADEVTRQREAAVPAVWQAQASLERASEAAKRADAEKRQVRTQELLTELREFEGCEFGPAGRQPGDGGGPAVGAGVAGVAIVFYNRPRTQQLLDQAAEHGRKAVVLDHQEFNPNAGGEVSATSIDELIVLGLGDGQRAFPALREVERWAVEAEQAGRKRLRRIRDGFAGATPDPATAPATWTLTWRGRQGESKVSFLGLAGSAGIDNYVDNDAGFVQVGERSWIRPEADAAVPAKAE